MKFEDLNIGDLILIELNNGNKVVGYVYKIKSYEKETWFKKSGIILRAGTENYNIGAFYKKEIVNILKLIPENEDFVKKEDPVKEESQEGCGEENCCHSEDKHE